MKKLLNRSIIVLILIYSMERFTYYGFKSFLPLFMAGHQGWHSDNLEELMKIVNYVSMISLFLSALLIDRIKWLRNIQIYFILLIAGLLLCLGNSFQSLAVGITIMVLVGTFIKVNVFVKIFGHLCDDCKLDGSVFVLLYVAANLFSGLAPIIGGGLYSMTGGSLAFLVTGILTWMVLGGLVLRFYKEEATSIAPHADVPKMSRALLILIMAIVVMAINTHLPQHFALLISAPRGGNVFNSIAETLPKAAAYAVGIFILIKGRFNVPQKMPQLIALVLVNGILIYFGQFISGPKDAFKLIVDTSSEIAGLLLYPAVVVFILVESRKHQRATLLSLFFLGIYVLRYMESPLKSVDYSSMILIAEMLLAGILFLSIRYKRLAVLGSPNVEH